MYQRAEDPREREERVPTPPEREERVIEVIPASNGVRQEENDRRQDLTDEGRRPTIEPASESSQNVTPIRTRHEPQHGAPGSETDDRVDVTQSPTHAALFPSGEVERFRTDWQTVQATFVDDPRTAIRQADELVSRTIARLSDVFGDERRKLEPRPEQDSEVSTEDLRLGLQRYRAFFDRLLSL